VADDEQKPSESDVNLHSVTEEPRRFSDEDELPEEEPLTPELVEEEAIRGDFMLRWAVVFLAILFGFSQFNDTRTLLQIRSGEQMRANGFLPLRADNLSFTAEGAPVSNVSWLYDHLISALWAAGEGTALTVFKALMAGLIAWLLVNISVSGIPTWWTAICSLLAVVACSGDFIPLPELMTLLGMVLVVRYLHQHREGVSEGLTWKLPLLIAVWCNLDSRAWIGPVAICLYAIGCAWASRQQPGDPPVVTDSGRPLTSPVAAALLSVLALLVNPFPMNSLFSSIALYSVEYPTLQQQKSLRTQMASVSFDSRVDNYSMLHPDAFMSFDHTQISGLTLVLIAFVLLLMARDRRNAGIGFALCGVFFLAILATHELPAAAIVAAVAASTTAQRWYRANYSLQYTIDPRELFFSRTGRAVTVLGMAALGFCVVAARLPGNTPVGLGFDKDTLTTIETVGRQLKEIDPEARILHTRVDQGDILVWHGRKSCIDSRMLPFGRMSDPNSVVARHKQILDQMLLPQKEEKEEKEREKQMAAKAAALKHLQEMKVSHVMIRLSPPGSPDYRSVQMLTSSPGWILANIGPSAAVIERVNPGIPPAEMAKKVPQFSKMAFQDAVPLNLEQRDFARQPDFYQRFVYRTRPVISEFRRQAEHYLWLAGGQPRSIEEASLKLSLITLAIRSLNQTLNSDSQDAIAYRQLGIAYHQLGMIEALVSGDSPTAPHRDLRDLQAIMALRQSQNRLPDDPEVNELLMQIFLRKEYHDLALEYVEKVLNKVRGLSDTAQMTESIKEMTELSKQLQNRIDVQEKGLKDYLAKEKAETDPAKRAIQIFTTAQELARGGFRRRSLQMLRQHADLVGRLPEGQLLTGRLLLETGEIEEGHRVLNQLGAAAAQQTEAYAGMGWHLPTAASQLAVGSYESAIGTWTDQLRNFERLAESSEPITSSLMTVPGAASAAPTPQAPMPTWPFTHLNALQIPMQLLSGSRADIRMMIALAHFENGDVAAAKIILQGVISECGESPGRNLATVYYSMCDSDPLPFLEKNSLDQWEEFEFTSVSTPTGSDTGKATTPKDADTPASPDTPATATQEPAKSTEPATATEPPPTATDNPAASPEPPATDPAADSPGTSGS
jgi:tetratricopeptide (TPR) repeat protein